MLLNGGIASELRDRNYHVASFVVCFTSIVAVGVMGLVGAEAQTVTDEYGNAVAREVERKQAVLSVTDVSVAEADEIKVLLEWFQEDIVSYCTERIYRECIETLTRFAISTGVSKGMEALSQRMKKEALTHDSSASPAPPAPPPIPVEASTDLAGVSLPPANPTMIAGPLKDPCENCRQRGNALVNGPDGRPQIRRNPPAPQPLSPEERLQMDKLVAKPPPDVPPLPIPDHKRRRSVTFLDEDVIRRRTQRIQHGLGPGLAQAAEDVGRRFANRHLSDNPVAGAEAVAATSVRVPWRRPRAYTEERRKDRPYDPNYPGKTKQFRAQEEAEVMKDEARVYRVQAQTTGGPSGAFGSTNPEQLRVQSNAAKAGVETTALTEDRQARRQEILEGLAKRTPAAQKILDTVQRRPGKTPAAVENCGEVLADLRADVKDHPHPRNDRITVVFGVVPAKPPAKSSAKSSAKSRPAAASRRGRKPAVTTDTPDTPPLPKPSAQGFFQPARHSHVPSEAAPQPSV